MQERYGIILLDGCEIIARIYEKTSQGKWTLLHYHDRDLTTFDNNTKLTASDIVEVIVQISLSKWGEKVDDWKIISRNLDEEVSQHVSMATGIYAEYLTLQREQELLCKGVLKEVE